MQVTVTTGISWEGLRRDTYVQISLYDYLGTYIKWHCRWACVYAWMSVCVPVIRMQEGTKWYNGLLWNLHTSVYANIPLQCNNTTKSNNAEMCTVVFICVLSAPNAYVDVTVFLEIAHECAIIWLANIHGWYLMKYVLSELKHSLYHVMIVFCDFDCFMLFAVLNFLLLHL